MPQEDPLTGHDSALARDAGVPSGADQAPGQLADQLLLAGDEADIGSAKRQGNPQRLAVAHGEIGALFKLVNA